MKSVDDGRVVIVGAGPAGLGAAYMLHRAGVDNWVVYERENDVGGLATSVVDEKGYTWDIGGHVVFSHYGLYSRLLDDLLGPAGWIEHQRESWIRVLRTWVPYPFQNNIHRLPADARVKCLEGLLRATMSRRDKPFANFKELIIDTFGDGIAELFMLPYNYKVWAHEPEGLGVNWIGERVAVPDPVRVARNVALNADDASWGPNNTFRFPRHGGTGAIWRTLASQLPQPRIATGCGVTGIDVDARRVFLSDGRQDDYGTLISTMPLDRLVRLLRRQPWIEAANRLLHSSVHIVGVGLNGKAPPDLATKCWMYFPEDNCPFYRVTHFSLYSPNNVDDINVHWSLMCEVSESPVKPIDRAGVVDDVVRGLVAAGLIESAQQVCHTWSTRVEYSYPIPTPDRDDVLDFLLPALAEKGILSRGRFGAWRYEVANQDHAFMQGYEAAAHVIHGSPELTVWDPGFVNTPHRVLGWDRVR
jgi:protoporphyrinogen oxidase